MDQCAVCQPAAIQIEPELTLLAIEAVRTVCLPVNTEFLQTVVGFFLQCCVMLFRRCVLPDDEARILRQRDVIQRPGLDLIRPARRDGVEDLAARAVCVLHGVDQGIGGVFQLEDSALERFPVLIELLQRQTDLFHRVGEDHRAGDVLDDRALRGPAAAQNAVNGVRHGVAARVKLRDLIAQADGQVFDPDGLARLQTELTAVVEDEVCLRAAVVFRAGIGVIVPDPAAVCIGELDVEGEFLVLVRVVLADDLLADLKIAGLLLDVDAGDRGQRKVHVARRAGRATLGVEEGERVLLVFRAVCADIIPQVHVFTDGRVDAADVADERVVQKDPHIVVAEERIVQRPDIIRRQRKRHRILHAEEGVVRLSVVAVWKRCGFVTPCAADAVRAGKALIIDGIAVAAELRIHSYIRIGHAVQRPEIVCENVRVRRISFRGRIEEILQTADRSSTNTGGGKRVGIAHLGEGQGTVFKGFLAVRIAFIEQVGRNEPIVIYDLSV